MSTENRSMDELMANFGEASYSPEFWAAVRESQVEEQERSAREELQEKLANQKLLSKMYTI